MNERRLISPIELSRLLDQPYAPTEQQAAVIGAPAEPMLVVAGAGAGKTETMAARVVWLVANGFVRPEEVLGLTFTRKAARELGQRIRGRLAELAMSRGFRRIADPGVLTALEVIAPEVSTYDAYAGTLVRDYGLLLPAEPSAQVLDGTAQWQVAWDLVLDRADINTGLSPTPLVKKLMSLSEEMDSQLVDPADVREQTEAFLHNIRQLPPSKAQKSELHSGLTTVVAAQEDRLELLPLVAELRARHDDMGAVTFGRQMSRAARLADGIAEVGEAERTRFRVIMLDEYQDTSHAQRVLLRALFAGSAVTAVGDPMQAIYEWRGATSENLNRFVTDFPRPDGSPARKLQLTTSWRNPADVLELANDVSDRAFEGGPRTVEALEPRPGADAGEVTLALHATVDEEIDWLANHLEAEYREAVDTGRPLSAAVLVRKNADSRPILEALAARDVPAEIVGLSGLLTLPEVLDVIAVLRVLADPADDAAMLRILVNPLWNLGAADIRALGRRAKQLASYGGPARGRGGPDDADPRRGGDGVADGSMDGGDTGPLTALDEYLEGLAEELRTPPTGLGHAVADPATHDDGPSAPGYSVEGARRIGELSAVLRNLRRWSLRKPLPELIADVEEAFGLRIEAAAGTASGTTAGTVHLDRFTEVAADFGSRDGGGLKAFLGYLEVAAEHDKGLEPGKVRLTGDRVEILTVHKAKGLEWDVVAVPHACATIYDNPRVEVWLSKAELLPPEATGSAESGTAGDDGSLDGPLDGPLDGAPILDASDAEDQGQLVKAIKENREEYKAAKQAENDRLFYVAITRAGRRLLVSGCQRKGRGRASADGPSKHLTALAALRPDAIETWVTDVPEDPLPLHTGEGVAWPAVPSPEARTALGEAAALVAEAAAGDAIEPIDGDLSRTWEDEVSLLLEERRRADAEAVSVPMPVQLSTSEYQALRSDPVAFARRRARPLPYKPNRFARRGTAFHAWLENRFGTATLLDDDDLFDIANADAIAAGATGEPGGAPERGDAAVGKLKEGFLGSEWADRTPVFVEEPFEIGVGGRRIVGRIDAIYRIDGHWMVVDWKTGRRPTGERARHAALQLAVYRIAWADRRRALGEDIDPADVRAAFHYIADGVTVEPGERDLPDRLELDEAMRELVAAAEPGTGPERDRTGDGPRDGTRGPTDGGNPDEER
ncbi:ATP-dependent DNA helicase [uncultured Corynebacterium sp.]|uniref:ATP-dependent helicase n=1 Tax=uncultured Corynebacterium sp. TaxID=159447 RepID=UPI002621D285|nr:ATP-dependent DNA helicase [uncultured Corynebacterium sp.]